MLRALVVFLVLTLPFMAFGQDVVKVNILEIANKIPAPPTDVKDAFSRTVEVQQEGSVSSHRETGPYYKPVKDKMEAVNKQIEKALQVLAKPQMDVANEMNQKEMQKKFQTMSQEEQMKMAMEMSKKMGMGAIVPESEPVKAATTECINVNQAIGQDMQGAQEWYRKRQKMEQDREKQHSDIDAWKETELAKLPQVSYGEMGGPEPKAEYALLTKVMQKHLTVENDYLKAVQKEWKAGWDKYVARFSRLQEKLAKINYGADAKNPTTKQQLLTGQGQMVSGTGDLIELSSKATKSTAEWWQRKLELEKNKPKD